MFTSIPLTIGHSIVYFCSHASIIICILIGEVGKIESLYDLKNLSPDTHYVPWKVRMEFDS